MHWPRLDLDLAPVRCAVVGAVATRQYMPERRTADIDVLVRRSDADRVHERLKAAGYESRGSLSIGGSTWRAPSGAEVDVIEGDEPWAMDAIGAAQNNRDLQGLPVLPLPYLVLMKLRSSRAQDLADLSRMLGQAGDEAIEATTAVVRRYARGDLSDLRSLIELGRMELRRP